MEKSTPYVTPEAYKHDMETILDSGIDPDSIIISLKETYNLLCSLGYEEGANDFYQLVDLWFKEFVFHEDSTDISF